MSDDIYYIEEIPVNQTNALSDGVRPASNDLTVRENKSQDCRLLEIEQQLEMAESRCNTLKGQVTYMKMLYNGLGKEDGDNASVVNAEHKPRHSEVPKTSKRKRTQLEKNPKRTHHEELNKKDVKTIRKNDGNWKEQPSRDTTKLELPDIPHHDDTMAEDVAGAERSISNIITGITHSVNRLSQLHVQIPHSVQTNVRPKVTEITNAISPMQEGVQDIQCAPKNIRSTKPEKPYQTNPHNDISTATANFMNDLKARVSRSQKRSKSVSGHQNQKSGISISEIKKRIKALPRDKKIRPIPNIPIKGDKGTMSRRPPEVKPDVKPNKTYTVIPNREEGHMQPNPGKSDNIIELYHNSAVLMDAPSEVGVAALPRRPVKVIQQKPTTIFKRIPEEQIMHQNYYPQQAMAPALPTMPQRMQSMEVAPRPTTTECVPSYPKNYELPTIASKMKQVAKTYFQNFTFRTIPFVAATSTSPSHNLGINIQQVLSIIKGRKPLTGISPTLAYNIELAANKLGSRPFSALVSNLGSRLTSKCVCPAGPRRMNISQLAEMAKEVTEDSIIDSQNNVDNDVICKNFECGDKISRQTWIVDPSIKKEQCLCVDKPGVNFEDVCSRYMQPAQGYGDSTSMQIMHQPPPQQPKKMKRPWNFNVSKTVNRVDTRPAIDRHRSARPVQQLQTIPSVAEPETSNMPAGNKVTNRVNMVASRERNLKEILRNLHSEFSTLNDRYEDLKTNLTNGNVTNPDEQLKELECLEKDLLNKENEITMVMTLYKEVVSLKQQIKVLKKQASQMSVTVTPYTRYKDYKEQNAAGHLTKLLRHIQQFQESLKRK